MLYNVPLAATTIQDESTFPVKESLHEGIPVIPGSVSKTGFDPAQHYNGTIVNVSGLSGEDYGAVIWLYSVVQGAEPPTVETILTKGLPLLPGGSAYEIPHECALEYYLASASVVEGRGAYLTRSEA
jgi:hypothetical protein